MSNEITIANAEETLVIFIMQVIFSSITILLVLFSTTLFICHRSIRTFPVELLLYLCITEMLANLFDIIPSGSSDSDLNLICYLQAFSEMCFPLASMIITTFIGVVAYVSTKYEEIYLRYKNQIRIVILCLSLIISSIFGLVIIFLDLIGRSSTSCYLDFRSNDSIKKRNISILIYVYYFLCFVLIIISYRFISKTKKLLGNIPELNTEEINKYLNKLRLYPIILLVTTVPVATHRIFQLYNNNFYIWFDIAQTVFDSLRGILFVIFDPFNLTLRK